MATQTREEVLQQLTLKTIVKEHHAQPLRALAFNQIDADKRNLFVTVGGNQTTIYDDSHFGSYVAVVQQLVNVATDSTPGGELTACCWLSCKGGRPTEILGDGLLAVGGKDCHVSLISMTSTSVVALLKGHTKEILDLASCSARPDLLLSLAKDGAVRLWDVVSEDCIAVCTPTQPSAVCFNHEGSGLYVGSSSGQVSEYTLPAEAALAAGKRKRAETVHIDSSKATAFATHFAGAAVDCMRTISAGRLVTKSVDGRVCVWEAATKKQLAAWKVPGCGGDKGRSAFSVTCDGEMLSVGNSSGDVYVFSISGARLAHFPPAKVRAPVVAVAMTEDCKHVLAAFGAGFVWRFELIQGGGAAAVAADVEDDD